MKLPLISRLLTRSESGRGRSRRQHLSNLVFILLAGLTVFNIKSFWYGLDSALEAYTDFSQFYAGAIIVRNGLGQDLYTYETQEKLQQQLYSTADSRTGPVLYYHAPFEILIFLPLTYASYPKAYSSWVVINLIILLAVPLLLFPYLPNLRPTFRINIVLSFFSFFPIFIAVYHGQDSLLLLLLFACAFVSLKRGRLFWAGFLLGLGLFRFHLVVPFMLLFVIKKEWRVIQGFSIAAVFVSIMSVWVTGWQGMIKYVDLLWEINQNLTDRAHQVRFALYPRTMANLRGLIYTLFSGQISDTVITIISASFSLIVLIWLFVYLSKEEEAGVDIDLEFSLGIVAMLLVGIHLHLYDWSLLMLPILLLFNHYAGESSQRGRVLWTLRFTMLLLLMTPIYMMLITLELTSILVVPLLVFAYLIQREISNLHQNRRQHA
jgi:hypothetical protein